MEKLSLRYLPVIFALFILAGCGGKTLVKEDIEAGTVPSAQKEAAKGTIEEKTVSDEVIGEKLGAQDASVASEDISGKGGKGAEVSPAKEQRQYASLGPGDQVTAKAEEQGMLRTVHFDFDNYTIRDEDKEILVNNARWLKLNSGVKVTIEGHADERGEGEYNLALGEKRAQSVKKYLTDLGVSIERLSTITFGEERPVDPAHSEEAWMKNRRAEFVISD